MLDDFLKTVARVIDPVQQITANAQGAQFIAYARQCRQSGVRPILYLVELTGCYLECDGISCAGIVNLMLHVCPLSVPKSFSYSNRKRLKAVQMLQRSEPIRVFIPLAAEAVGWV